MRRLKATRAGTALAGAALLATAPSAAAEQLSSGMVSASASRTVTCHDGLLGIPAAARRTVTAPARGLLTVRLAARSGDWDLGVLDAASGRSLGGGAGAGARETAAVFVGAGRRVVVQACRRRSSSSRARLTVDFTALPRKNSRVQIVRVALPDEAARRRLAGLGLDLTEHGGKDFMDVVVYSAAEKRSLTLAGLRFDIRVAGLAPSKSSGRRSADPDLLPSGRTQYRRLADYEAELKNLALANPGLVRLFALPERSLEGRLIHGIEITSQVNVADGKPVMLQMGLHHAREWPSGEHAMEWAHELVNGYGSDPRATEVVDGVRTIIVPVVNPDGFDLSRQAPDEGTEHELKRKNCRVEPTRTPDPGECATAEAPATGGELGVDLNRNYGGLWGGPGQSFNPTDDDYSGAGPFSEPETRNVQWLVSRNQVTTLITNHTYGDLILRPPGVRESGPTHDEERYAAIGAHMAAKNGYRSDQAWTIGYSTTGTTEDWSYFATGGLAYTFEIGDTASFHPPFAATVAGWAGNREAYYVAADATRDRNHHGVLEGDAPAGLTLRLSKRFKTASWPQGNGTPILLDDHLETTLTVPDSGLFEWHVNPSDRPIGAADGVATTPTWTTSFAGSGKAALVPGQTLRIGGDDPPGTYEDVLFTVPAGDHARLRVTITPKSSGEDWDLVLFRRRSSDGAYIPLGSSRFPGGQPAVVTTSQATPGTYVARAVNRFASGITSWKGEAETFAADPPEAWTLTCEDAGNVLRTHQIVVGRGQVIGDMRPCD